jgi:hypothetical protein
VVIPVVTFAQEYFLATVDLNVRVGAGTGHEVVFTLKRGDEVEVLSKQGKWYEIRFQGRTGYASSKYLRYSRTYSKREFQKVGRVVTYLLIGAYAFLALLLIYFIAKWTRDRKLLRSVTSPRRGTPSERDLVMKLLKSGVPPQTIFHDLYVKTDDGKFSQTDLAVVTDVGIIVFEVKEYSGWIFGNGNQSQWTKVLAYGRQKYSFYNPIMQNNRHIAELRKQLYQFENLTFFSVVVFYGNCELKDISFVPRGAFIVKAARVLEVIRSILKENPSIGYRNENEVIRILGQAVANGALWENQVQHSQNIREMLGTDRVFD